VCELPAVECLVQRHAQLVDIGEPGDVLFDAAGDRIDGVGVHSFSNTQDCEDFVAGAGRGRAPIRRGNELLNWAEPCDQGCDGLRPCRSTRAARAQHGHARSHHYLRAFHRTRRYGAAGLNSPRTRVLRPVLGDQLWRGNPVLDRHDPAQDHIVMIEAPGEADVVCKHKARIALFLAAMRHFRDALTAAGLPVHYVELEAPGPPGLPERLRAAIDELRPRRVLACEPGEWRLKVALAARAAESGVPLEWCADTHFLVSTADFERWAAGRSGLRMEFFYRE
jgi:hypothetical protein